MPNTIYITYDEKIIADICDKVAEETGSPVTAVVIGAHNADELSPKGQSA
jgi:hypothetical protein